MMQARMAPDAATSAAVLRIAAVGKRFGTLTVLDDCALDVAEGEIVTLLGPSGCGKTSFCAASRGSGRRMGARS
jgi:ABC-type branched-subunit amino acid transport system ATPase component